MAHQPLAKPLAQLPLSEKIVDQLLDKLSSDDIFRALFEKDPHAALVRLGYQPLPGHTLCLKASKLADKQTIAQTRDEMRRLMVLGTLWFIPNNWEANAPQV